MPERFAQFSSRYREELAAHGELLDELSGRARNGLVTIVYAARDQDHNNAVVLRDMLRWG